MVYSYPYIHVPHPVCRVLTHTRPGTECTDRHIHCSIQDAEARLHYPRRKWKNKCWQGLNYACDKWLVRGMLQKLYQSVIKSEQTASHCTVANIVNYPKKETSIPISKERKGKGDRCVHLCKFQCGMAAVVWRLVVHHLGRKILQNWRSLCGTQLATGPVVDGGIPEIQCCCPLDSHDWPTKPASRASFLNNLRALASSNCLAKGRVVSAHRSKYAKAPGPFPSIHSQVQ